MKKPVNRAKNCTYLFPLYHVEIDVIQYKDLKIYLYYFKIHLINDEMPKSTTMKNTASITTVDITVIV